MTTPGTLSSVVVAFLDGIDGPSSTNAHYSFTFVAQNPIPTSGKLVITVPSATDGIVWADSGLTLLCTTNCDASSATLTGVGNDLEITGLFDSYVDAGNSVVFSIRGWTNAKTTAAQTFVLATKWEDATNTWYDIDTATSNGLSTAEGECTVSNMYPTDGNTMYMDEPKNYTVVMSCVHDIDTTMGLRLRFPSGASDWTIMDTGRCVAAFDIPRETGTPPRYSCNAYNETRTIEVFNFANYDITGGVSFSWTVGDAIINPASLKEVGVIEVETLTSSGDKVDNGTYQFADKYFNASLIETFTVTPLNLGVGMFPVTYQFRVIPTGDVPAGAYFEIELPDQIRISDEYSLEKECGGVYRDTMLAFSHWELNCKL